MPAGHTPVRRNAPLLKAFSKRPGSDNELDRRRVNERRNRNRCAGLQMKPRPCKQCLTLSQTRPPPNVHSTFVTLQQTRPPPNFTRELCHTSILSKNILLQKATPIRLYTLQNKVLELAGSTK